MPGIARVGIDSAGGKITGNLAPTVFVNGAPIAVFGAEIEAHGDDPHSSPTMLGHSVNVYANNILVSRALDKATCDDVANGSENVFAG